jgi:hypothetical protein
VAARDWLPLEPLAMPTTRQMLRKIDWAMFDYLVNKHSRKDTIHKLIECGLSPRQAIAHVRQYEAENRS